MKCLLSSKIISILRLESYGYVPGQDTKKLIKKYEPVVIYVYFFKVSCPSIHVCYVCGWSWLHWKHHGIALHCIECVACRYLLALDSIFANLHHSKCEMKLCSSVDKLSTYICRDDAKKKIQFLHVYITCGTYIMNLWL
jgi:hypothetical protein